MDNRCTTAHDDKNKHVTVTRTVSLPPKYGDNPSLETASSERQKSNNNNLGEVKLLNFMSRSETSLIQDTKTPPHLLTVHSGSLISKKFNSGEKKQRGNHPKWISLELLRTDESENKKSKVSAMASKHSKSDNQINVMQNSTKTSKSKSPQQKNKNETVKKRDNANNTVSNRKHPKAPSESDAKKTQKQNQQTEQGTDTRNEHQYPLIIQWPPPRKINRSQTNYDKGTKKASFGRGRDRKSLAKQQEHVQEKQEQTPANLQRVRSENSQNFFHADIIWHKSKSFEDIRGKYAEISTNKYPKRETPVSKKPSMRYQKTNLPKIGDTSLTIPAVESTVETVCKECTRSIVDLLKEESGHSRRFLQKSELSESSSQESVGHRSRLDRMRDFTDRNREINSRDRLPKYEAACTNLYGQRKPDPSYLDHQILEEKQNQALNKWFSDNQDYGTYSDASHEDYCSESDSRPLLDRAKISCPADQKFSRFLEETNEEQTWSYRQSLRKYDEKRISSIYAKILSQVSTDSEGREEIESDATSNLDTKSPMILPSLTKLDHDNELSPEPIPGEFFPPSGMGPRSTSPNHYTIDSDSGDRSAPRSPYIPRRFSTRPLRGPYGEMLEAEMSKSKPNSQLLNEEFSLNAGEGKPSTRPTSPQSPTLMIPKDQHFMAFDSPAILVSPDLLETDKEFSFDDRHRFVQTCNSNKGCQGNHLSPNTMPPSPAFLSEDEKGGDLLSIVPIPLHQRTASSPSKLCLEEKSESEKGFSGFSSSLVEAPILKDPFNLKNKRPKSQEYDNIMKEDSLQKEFSGVRSKTERELKRHPSSAQQQKKNTADGDHARSLSEHRHVHRRYRDTRNHVVCELRDTEANYVRNLSFLLNKYDHTLRSSEYNTIVDSSVVDTIFYQVPEIHSHHVKMLDQLKRRMEPPVEESMCVGDILLKTFKDQRVLESYSNFINNWKNAQEAAKATSQTKPAFRHFLLAMSREHPGKRELKSLLIMPVQRFPRYELLLKRLLEHTGRDHPDYSPLKDTIYAVQRIANILNDIEQEALKQEQQQFILKEIEASIEGIVGLQQTDRTFIQVDQISQHSNLGMRKERCLFLFSDLLVITSVKRRSASARKITCVQPVLLNFLESSKFKLFKFIPLDDIEIGRSREESLKRKFLRELEALEQDLQTLQQVSRLVKTLHFPKANLEEALNELDSSLKKQYLERQRVDSHLSELELTITTAEGVEVMGFIFHKPEAKDQWEEAFNSAKQRQAQSADRRPPPEFVVALPVRKTRAGLQFTCAAPILSHNVHKLRDVWICNSDGYVGQVCVMSLQPEPTLASCIGICNARIMSIASVPSAPLQSSISVQRFSYRYSSDEEDEEDLSLTDDIHNKPRSESLPPEINMEESENQQPTMWLGTEDGSIIVYNCADTIRTKRNKFKFQPGSPVYCIIHVENKVFASLANGDVIVYERDYLGSWNGGRRHIINLSTAAYPVTRMIVGAGRLWCSVANGIRVINPNTLQVEHAFTVGEEEKSIACMVSAGYGVWIAMTASSTVKLHHATTFELVCEVAITSPVSKMLAGCDDIIRQHKAACLRVTALLACKDLLWIGTSAGVIITIPLPHLTHNTRKIQNPLNMHGIPHGHTGHVRFLTSVELTADLNPSRLKGHTRISFKGKEHPYSQPETVAPTKFMVISGGDGYEDFRNSSLLETAGKDDSTNHLLSWHV